MKTLFYAIPMILAPGICTAGMMGGPCQDYDMDEPDLYCASFIHQLSQYAEDFEIDDVEGKYALDCSGTDGIEFSGIRRDTNLTMSLDGQQIDDAMISYSYYGNGNPPVNFIVGVFFEDYDKSFSVNGDQYGYYVVEDWGKGRRLSHCAG